MFNSFYLELGEYVVQIYYIAEFFLPMLNAHIRGALVYSITEICPFYSIWSIILLFLMLIEFELFYLSF